MDPKWQLVCFLLAFVCFAVAAVWEWDKPFFTRPRLLPLGLAFVDLVWLVGAWKAV